MSALSISVPYPVFSGQDGLPLDNGYVWIGTANLYPITNPIAVYFDEALTIQATQPLRTINGFISNAGTPAQVYVDAVNFSILVQDSKGTMVYNFPDGTGISPDACGVTYDPPFTGAVAYPVCEKLAQTVSVNDFGAVGDGITNDTNAFQAAIDAMALQGGGTVTFTNRYLIDTNLSIKDYVTLEGPLGLPDELLPGNSASYETQSGVLILNSSATITVLDGASIGNCLVVRKGLDLPFTDASSATTGVAAFAGTAFTVGGAGAYFHHLLILGFTQAIYSINKERIRCEYVMGDNTNGIHIETCFDISYIENCHFWPWTTTHQSWTTNILLTRSGCAYRFRNTGDWNKFTNCFSYGYSLGFDIDSCDHVTLIGCGTDFVGNLSATNVGTQIKGTSSNVALIRHQAAAQGTGVEVNTTAGTGGVVTFIGCDFWDNDIQHLVITTGRAIIDSCTFRSGPAGVVATGNTPQGVQVINCDFELTTTPLNITGKALERSTFFANRFFNCVTSQSIRTVSDNQPEQRFDTAYNSSGSGPILLHRVSRGDITTPVTVQNTDIMSKLNAMGFDGSNFISGTGIRAQVNGSVSVNSVPGQIIFSTIQATQTTLIDRVALNNNGYFLPLTDNVYSLGASGFRWSEVWAANGTIQTSDERAKTNVKNSELGLNFINSLRPVSYKFKSGGNKVIKQIYRNNLGKECEQDDPTAKPAEIIKESVAGNRTHWGLIAQEVKASADKYNVDFGGWIKTDLSDVNSEEGLRYEELIAPLIKAVQELSAKVIALENK
jgi:hypothetical protein